MISRSVDTAVLADGNVIPSVGLGVWQMSDMVAEDLSRAAVDAGYRLIDTAAIYGNERGVGRAIRDCGVARDELFVTTKVWNDDQGYDTTIAACKRSLVELGLDYVDMYMIHWAMAREGKFVDTFRALLTLRDEELSVLSGLNFTEVHLRELLDSTGHLPVVNQIELHPRMTQQQMLDFHATHRIVTQAWSPLGHGAALDVEEIVLLARKYERT